MQYGMRMRYKFGEWFVQTALNNRNENNWKPNVILT